MYSNDQVRISVINLTRNIEVFVNHQEEELGKEEPNLLKIATLNGKIATTYSLIAEMTGIFTGYDWRAGGPRESKHAIEDLFEKIEMIDSTENLYKKEQYENGMILKDLIENPGNTLSGTGE